MNELINYFINRINKWPLISEVLFVFSFLAIIFGFFQYFYINPESKIIFEDYRLQLICVLAIFFWLTTLSWRYISHNKIKLLLTILPIVIGITLASKIIKFSNVDQINIQIIYDETALLSSLDKTKLHEILQSSLFNVEILEKPIQNIDDSPDELSAIEVFEILDKVISLPSQSKKIIVYITGKSLSDNYKWNNLYFISWKEASVISTRGVAINGTLTNKTLHQYLATSIAYSSIISSAKRRNKDIFDKNSRNTFKNCLYDFDETRNAYMLQVQKPKLCESEAQSIQSIFGKATLKALNEIFVKISNNL